MSATSQNSEVLRHLRRGKRLTAMGALSLIGTFRLAARIWDLRRSGHKIERRLVEVGRKRVAEYWLAR